MKQRWKHRPAGSNWGEFGPDDQLGRLNLLTPAKVLQGVAEVKAGHSFCLSLPLDYPGGNVLNPSRFPPRRFATDNEGQPRFNYPLDALDPDWIDVVCDDAVLLHTQYSTQWDSLCHIGSQFDADGDGEAEIVYYNGWRGGEHILGPEHLKSGAQGCARHEGSEARALGIENMAATGVQGRAVLVNLFAHYGRERKLVGFRELQEIFKEDGIEIESGDMVCFYTGFADVVLEQQQQPTAEVLENRCVCLNGRDPALLQWVTDSGVVALIADNYAVEGIPAMPAAGRHPRLPLHEHCLFKLGVHLGELWFLSELAGWLAENKRSRFLLTAPPLRLPGAVGSPTTPVATV